jgi:Flp pilus assembly protein TadB
VSQYRTAKLRDPSSGESPKGSVGGRWHDSMQDKANPAMVIALVVGLGGPFLALAYVLALGKPVLFLGVVGVLGGIALWRFVRALRKQRRSMQARDNVRKVFR